MLNSPVGEGVTVTIDVNVTTYDDEVNNGIPGKLKFSADADGMFKCITDIGETHVVYKVDPRMLEEVIRVLRILNG